MVAFIDQHREQHGVEPICAVLPIAPSVYYVLKARQADPTRLPPRVTRDAALRLEIRRVWNEQDRAYGAKKVWKQLRLEGIFTARCTVARLTREMGHRGMIRGRTCRTTTPDANADHSPDLVKRNFTATRPNQLWVADLT